MSAPVPSIRIPGVIRKSGESDLELQIDHFKWHLPFIYTHCLETIWNFLEKIHAFWYTSSHSQNASKLLTEKLPKYSKPRSFRGELRPWCPLPGLCPGPTGDLKRSPDPSQTFVPPNTKSWIRPWRQCSYFAGTGKDAVKISKKVVNGYFAGTDYYRKYMCKI